MDFYDIFSCLPEGFRLAREEDRALVTLTFAQAFADYPYPIPSLPGTTHSTHLRFFYDGFRDQVDNALRRGVVLTNEDMSAVMMVTPLERACELRLVQYAENMRQYAPEEQVQNMLGIMHRIREKEGTLRFRAGTLYIEGLAVQTPRQGQKLGSSLLRMLHAQCDRDDRDIFLFTNTRRNADIYRHLGYDTLLFDHCGELGSDTWFMLRPAPGR